MEDTYKFPHSGSGEGLANMKELMGGAVAAQWNRRTQKKKGTKKKGTPIDK